jgi:hypothetical protein
VYQTFLTPSRAEHGSGGVLFLRKGRGEVSSGVGRIKALIANIEFLEIARTTDGLFQDLSL